MTQHDTLFIVYEPAHIELARASGARIVVLDFWIERELARRGIAHESLSGFISHGWQEEYFYQARDAAREWYRIPQMRFFEHQGIALGEVFEPMLDTYFHEYLYYLRVFEDLLAHHPTVSRLLVPHTAQQTSGSMAPVTAFSMRKVVDAARTAAQARGVAFETLGPEPGPPPQDLYPNSSLVDAFFSVYNTFIRLAPKRPIKIFASEYWKHIAPIPRYLPDAEMVLMERNQISLIPRRLLWSHRFRFIHPLAAGKAARATSAQKVLEYARAWREAKRAVKALPYFTLGGIYWWSAIEPALDYVVEMYAKRVLSDCDAIEAILKAENINRVMLRASIGGNLHHFVLVARIARRLGIPSVEVQHAGAVFDPKSVHSRLETDYLAAYGDFERDQYARNGYDPSRIVPIGSPRFDHYRDVREALVRRRSETLRALGLDAARPVVMLAVPAEYPGLYSGNFSSYDIGAFIREALKLRTTIPGLQLIFKFRPNACTDAHRAFVRELFGKDAAIAEHEDPFALICASDIVASGNSTIMYETMIGQKPLVLFPWKSYDYQLPLYEAIAPYARNGVELAAIVQKLRTDTGYAREVRERQSRFLATHSLDGDSSKRIAELIRTMQPR